jgi:hypothetical protein
MGEFLSAVTPDRGGVPDEATFNLRALPRESLVDGRLNAVLPKSREQFGHNVDKGLAVGQFGGEDARRG